MGNYLAFDKRVRIASALVEGCSIRSVCRMTGAAKGTVLKLVRQLGEACGDYQDKALRGLKTTRVECDEIWAFVGKKQKRAKQLKRDDKQQRAAAGSAPAKKAA